MSKVTIVSSSWLSAYVDDSEKPIAKAEITSDGIRVGLVGRPSIELSHEDIGPIVELFAAIGETLFDSSDVDPDGPAGPLEEEFVTGLPIDSANV